jgi:hypothetical protein
VQEVFFLAYHLHWSREEILTLPVPERHRYLELLTEQLKREQRAAQQGGN